MESERHERFMKRCLDLALLGAGAVSPNPMVGAVLVHQGRIIGEGWHRQYGGPHAEVNCIRSVREADRLLIPESTLYCNLEPCFHYGKTPPCVDLVLEHRIPAVVIANTDPNPKVAGQSIRKLREAGVEVVTGVLEREGAWLNRIFFHWIRTQTPYVILKWAQSADGYLGLKGARTRISGAGIQRLVHRWRSESDAILVGARTALIDNPRLDNRYYPGKPPLRIALDTQGKIPADYSLLDDSVDTWIFGPPRSGDYRRTTFIPASGKLGIPEILRPLAASGKSSLLVEGGAELLQQFIESESWQELRLIRSPIVLKNGLPSPRIPAGAVRIQTYVIEYDSVEIWAAPDN